MIENPYTQPHYLSYYWPIKPALIDRNRRIRGDRMKKPTQYWFINMNPKNNFIVEPMYINERRIHEHLCGKNKITGRDIRSEIAPEYANRFIREFLIEKDAPQPDKPDASNGNMDDSMPTLF